MILFDDGGMDATQAPADGGDAMGGDAAPEAAPEAPAAPAEESTEAPAAE